MISIIIPAYNIENYIEKALDSILMQTYKDIEIIVVDDGSTDNTAAIIDGYSEKHPAIKAVHISNGGVTNARLEGIKRAEGEYIGFVDGDDFIEPDMYELLMSNMLKHDADISHCGYKMLFADGRTSCFYNTGCVLEQNTAEGIRALLEGTLVEPGLWNKLFKKDLFKTLLNNVGIDKTIRINEDLFMNFLLFKEAKKSVFEDVCKYNYVIRKESASRQKLNKHKIYDPIKVRASIMKMANDENREDAERAYLNTCINTYNALVLERSDEFKDDKRVVRELIVRNDEKLHMLGRKRKLQAKIIIFFPCIYAPLYRIYVNHFQKDPYS